MAAPLITTAVISKSIQVANGCFARTVSLPAVWTTIRLGMLHKVQYGGTSIGGTPLFTMGMCAGTTNIYGDGTTDLFIGAQSFDASWSNSQSAYWYYSVRLRGLAREGSTNTYGISMVNYFSMSSTQTATVVKTLCDITKVNPTTSNVTIRSTYGGYTEANLYADLSVAAPGGYTVGTTSPVTHAASASTLNAANFSWSLASPVWYVGAIGVAVIA